MTGKRMINLMGTIVFALTIMLLLQVSAKAADPFTVMIPMRDEVQLAADVYLPDSNAWGPGPYPVILVMTPYNKTGMVGLTSYFQTIGYAVVIQDTRGRFESEGDYYPFQTAADDGYDTIEWIAEQSWCDGNVGTFGPSAMGIAQLLTGATQPPHLKAMSVDVATWDMHDHADFQGGALRLSMIEGWLIGQSYDAIDRWNEGENGKTTTVLDKFTERMDTWYAHLPLKNLPVLNRLQPSYNEIIAHPNDGPYWDPTRTDLDLINVPVLQFGGWYDIFSQGTIDVFQALQDQGVQTKLVVGAWTHFNYFTDWQGDRPLEGAALPGGYGLYFFLQGQWFDRWLKGIPNGIEFWLPPVSYYTTGADPDYGSPHPLLGPYWRQAITWPPPGIVETPYYFQAGMGPDPVIDDGLLVASAPPSEDSSISYVYDPKKDPVPTLGGNNLIIPGGAYDQKAVELRSDVISFSTESLAEDLEVGGRVIVILWASSSAPDTDFTAKLVDVAPPWEDNYARNVVDGIIRGRYRESDSAQSLLVPGEIYEFTIDLWSTSYLFKAGHKIRVDISSSNFPRFDRNPNTGHPFGQDAKLAKATNTIYFGPAYQSRIILPVVGGP